MPPIPEPPPRLSTQEYFSLLKLIIPHIHDTDKVILLIEKWYKKRNMQKGYTTYFKYPYNITAIPTRIARIKRIIKDIECNRLSEQTMISMILKGDKLCQKK